MDFLLQNNPRLWLKPWIIEFHLLTCCSYSIYQSFNWNNLGTLSAQKEILDEIKLCCLFERSEAVELPALIATIVKTWFNFLPVYSSKTFQIVKQPGCCVCVSLMEGLTSAVCVCVCAYVYFPKAVRQGEGWGSGEQSRLSGLLH